MMGDEAEVEGPPPLMREVAAFLRRTAPAGVTAGGLSTSEGWLDRAGRPLPARRDPPEEEDA